LSGTNTIAENQPDSFAFTPEYEAKADALIAKYPEGRQASAVIPLLDLVQRQHDNWVPQPAIDVVAEKLVMARIRVLEIATFYTMFNLSPVGKYFLQACKTTPCWLRGSDQMIKAINDFAGIKNHQSSDDGLFSLLEVECLGACVNAPVIQVNDDVYEDLDYDGTIKLLEALKVGNPPPVGSMAGRDSSANSGTPTALASLRATDGVRPTAQGEGDS
jgi:NADH-quinone oxidoreductase E subunit